MTYTHRTRFTGTRVEFFVYNEINQYVCQFDKEIDAINYCKEHNAYQQKFPI